MSPEPPRRPRSSRRAVQSHLGFTTPLREANAEMTPQSPADASPSAHPAAFLPPAGGPHPHPILIGCDGWIYADWEDVFYPHGLREDEYLGFYADRFPVAEVDRSFYRTPPASVLRNWVQKTPEHFRFVLKVPRSVTHEKMLKNCQADLDAFWEALPHLGTRLGGVFLQFGYANRQQFPNASAFLNALEPILAAWPHDRFPLAVEIRNPRWVQAEFLDLLRSFGTAFVLTEHARMPRPHELADRFDIVTGPFAMIRFLGDYEGIEQITRSWDRTVVDRSAELPQSAAVLQTIARRVPIFAFVSNRYSGHAPAAVRDLRTLLNLDEPTPPLRPRTTLFD